MTPGAVMIFAAGLGTRMGALTRDRPKPLIEVAGVALLDRALALARGAGVARIVVNTHAHAGQMQAHLARAAPGALISHEPELLETGGGIRQALPLLGDGPFFAINADTIWLDGQIPALRRLANPATASSAHIATPTSPFCNGSGTAT